jgi:hypothetical protein
MAIVVELADTVKDYYRDLLRSACSLLPEI